MNILSFFDFAIAVLAIVGYGSVWLYIPGSNLTANVMWKLVVILCFIGGSIRLLKSPLVKLTGLIAWQAIYLLCYIIIICNADTRVEPASILFLEISSGFYYAFSVVMSHDLINFAKRFSVVVFCMALISIVFFVFGTTLHFLRPSGVVAFKWDWMRTANTYNMLYFEPQVISILGLSSVVRNCGVYTEAPMFAVPLILGLIADDISGSRMIVRLTILAAIITTFSTTAYMLVIMFFIIRSVAAHLEKEKKITVGIVIVTILFCVAVMAISVLLDDKSATGSYSVRSDHMQKTIGTFIECLPFGCGIGNDETIMKTIYFQQGLSVGLTYLLAMSGIVGICLVFLPTLQFLVKHMSQNAAMALNYTIVFLVLFFMTAIVYAPLTWLCMGFFTAESLVE